MREIFTATHLGRSIGSASLARSNRSARRRTHDGRQALVHPQRPEGPGWLAKPASGKGPAVVVIQEWWGLVPHVMDVTERFAKEGFVAFAPDLYHGKTTTSPDEAGRLLMELDVERAGREIAGAGAFLLQRPECTSKKFGVVGFCMGGALAQYAATSNPNVGAAVSFYGGFKKAPAGLEVPRVPAPPHLRRQGHGRPRVRREAPRGRSSGRWARTSRRSSTPTRGHAFFNDSRANVYDPKASVDAWTEDAGPPAQGFGLGRLPARDPVSLECAHGRRHAPHRLQPRLPRRLRPHRHRRGREARRARRRPRPPGHEGLPLLPDVALPGDAERAAPPHDAAPQAERRPLEPATWEEALGFVAERLLAIRKESGPAAILHYRSGGSLGLVKSVVDYFFELLGPVTVKRGDICSGAGDAAQDDRLRRRGVARPLRPPEREERDPLGEERGRLERPPPARPPRREAEGREGHPRRPGPPQEREARGPRHPRRGRAATSTSRWASRRGSSSARDRPGRAVVLRPLRRVPRARALPARRRRGPRPPASRPRRSTSWRPPSRRGPARSRWAGAWAGG